MKMGNNYSDQPSCGPKGPHCERLNLNLVCSNTHKIGKCICQPGYTDKDPKKQGGRSKRFTFRGCIYDSFCSADGDCHKILGGASRCSKQSRKCECFDGLQQTYFEEGRCAVKNPSPIAERINNVQVRCQPNETWHRPLKMCLRKDHCAITEECKETEATQGLLYPKCSLTSGKCECLRGKAMAREMIYYKEPGKCFPKKDYNDLCEADEECRASLGPEVKCRWSSFAPGQPAKHVCLCPRGTQPGSGSPPYRCIGDVNYETSPRPETLPGASNYSRVTYGVGFPNVTQATPKAEKQGSPVAFGFLIGFGILAIVAVLIVAYFVTRRRLAGRKPKGPREIEMHRMATENEYDPLVKRSSFDTALSNLSVPIYLTDDITGLTQIGQGYFGLVFKGKLNEKTIAIKKFRREHNSDATQEMETMANFSHPNILPLLGVAKEDDTGAPWLLVEFMEHGDLASVLRDDRFRPGRELKGPIPTAPSRNEVEIVKGESMPTTVTEENYEHIEPLKLTPDKLVNISQQIAEGMKYLSYNRFVHRDLAARNCLVGENGTVKISDFGLSRDVYSSDYYKTGGSKLLPIRWMSPESIFYGRFTLESDVWAYGVVLWEIYSWGKQPYFGRSNEEVIKFVTDGNLLAPSSDCPPFIQEIMSGCWKTEPNDRPTFNQICERFSKVARLSKREIQEDDYEVPIKVEQGDYFQVV